jgi:hypothetical protein
MSSKDKKPSRCQGDAHRWGECPSREGQTDDGLRILARMIARQLVEDRLALESYMKRRQKQ